MTPDKSFIKTVGVAHFSTMDSEGGALFRVNAGVCVEDALEHASCLMGCANQLSLMAACEDEVGCTTWASHYLGEMAKAIIDDVASGLFQARNRL